MFANIPRYVGQLTTPTLPISCSVKVVELFLGDFSSICKLIINNMEYMSQEGYDKIAAELHELESVELPRVRDAIAEARDKGDLSENFEYHVAKREQGKLLGRIRFLQRVLEFARVIDTSKLRSDGIGLLSKVEMVNLANGAKLRYTIVSPHEASMSEGKLSIKSPIARALLGKNEGDEVEVSVPMGQLRLRIIGVTR